MRRLALVGMVCMAGAAALADTGFRQAGDGVFSDVKPPLKWAVNSNVVWNTKLKWSNASPIVLGDQVIVCEEPDVLLSLGFAEGKVRWAVTNNHIEVLPPAEAEVARENQKKIETLRRELDEAENRVRERGKAMRADTNDAAAKVSWEAAKQEVAALRKQVELLKKYQLPETHAETGYTSPTPVTDGRDIYAVFCSGVVVGVTPAGQRLWTRLLPVRPHHSWGHSASPRLAGDLVLVHYGNRLYALDTKTGADKWVVDTPSGFGSPFVAYVEGTPVVITPSGDLVALADGRKRGSGLFKFPWNGPVVKDGVIYQIDEGGAAAYAAKLDAAGKQAPLWTAKVPSGRYYATSLLHEGLLYNVSQGGTLVVLDAKGGSVVYEQPMKFAKGTTVYPSPTLGGGRIYVSCDNGETVVIRPGRAYEELARNKLPGFRSSPVFHGGSMLVRTLSGVMRVQEE